MQDIINHIENILEKNSFDYFRCQGCFDIITRKKQTYLLKVLNNVDSFQEEQANNLKILANNIPATAIIIGTHTRRESLKDNVIYERFDIPAITPDTLERILANEMPLLQRNRGGYFVNVDANKLREGRKKKQITQAELAKMVGVTKKNIYEHEAKDMSMHYNVAVKIEKILGNITTPANLDLGFWNLENIFRDKFEKDVSNDLSHLGFQTKVVYKTPFNIIAKEHKFMLISEADRNERIIERNIPYIEGFSKIAKKPALIVTKKQASFDLPSIEEKELRAITQKELKKLIKKG